MRPAAPFVLRQLTPAWRPLVGAGSAAVLTAALVVVQAWALTGLVVAVLDGRPHERWLALVVAVFTARASAGWLGDVLGARAAAVVGTGLRRRVVAAVLRGADAPSGELAALATRGVAAAEPYLTRYLPALVLAGVLPLLTLAAIASQDLLSFAVVLATLPLVPLFGWLVGVATRDRAQEQWRAMASLSGHFVDVLRGLPTLVAFRRAQAQSGTIRTVTDRYRRASLGTLRLAFASSAVLELVATLSVALVAVVVGVRLAGGGLALDTALLVLLLAPEAYWPLRRVGAEFHAAAEGLAAFEAVAALEDALPARPRSGPAAAARDGGTGSALVVSGLTVVHPGRARPAVHDLDAVLPAPGVTVVTGPSGCGKSTLLAALADLLPLTGGSVTLEGAPVGGDAWRSQVAWLPQRPVFLAGSVRDNLRLAAPAADDDRLWAALRVVALEERVRHLRGGLGAPLGEDGATLSAGERARLALARVVLAERRWVFLDEPTAHLDELTERVIADTIVDLGRRCGVVVVAHRPALVALADRVLELPARAPARAAVAAPGPAAGGPPAPDPRAPRPADADRRPASRPVPPGARAAGRRALWGSSLVGSLASASGVALTTTAGWLIVQAASRPPVLTLMVAIVGVRAFGLARPVLRYLERLRSHDAALRMLAERRVEVYDALVPLTPGRLGRRRGDLLASVVDDVDSLVDRELRVRLPIRQFLLVTALATVVAAALLPTTGVLVATISMTGGALAFGVARRGAARAERRTVELRGDLSALLVETGQSAQELVMWQADGPAGDRVADLSDRLGGASVRASAWLATARALTVVTAGVGVAALAAAAAPALGAGRLSGPELALLVLLPLALAEVVQPLADAGALSARTAAAADRLHRLERTPPAVPDTISRSGPAGSRLEVDRVTGGWDLHRAALRDVSLELAPGDRVAVVGPSGSGKSTLAALALRFLDPVAGELRLGGAPLHHLAADDVRRTVGLVDDDPHVFATTLVENVRFARPGASDAEVAAALRRARLGDWLDSLPDGLQTWLGDGHAQVSGGERARLAVARSLLAEQPVLVLDEPTAHLDHATATELAAELLDGPRGRTLLWITHGSVGLDRVDRVLDLAAPPPGPLPRPDGRAGRTKGPR